MRAWRGSEHLMWVITFHLYHHPIWRAQVGSLFREEETETEMLIHLSKVIQLRSGEKVT